MGLHLRRRTILRESLCPIVYWQVWISKEYAKVFVLVCSLRDTHWRPVDGVANISIDFGLHKPHPGQQFDPSILEDLGSTAET
jgi:hypothetical protein